MRCNEQRPRCAHCERLNLDCTWHRTPIPRNNTSTSTQSQATASPQLPSSNPSFNQEFVAFNGTPIHQNAFFDFSGPLGMGTWDEAMLLSPNSWPADPSMAGTHPPLEIVPQPIHQLAYGQPPPTAQEIQSLRHSGSISSIPERTAPHPHDPNSTSPFSTEGAPNVAIDEDFLVNTFLQMLMPPILTPVEIGPKWASTRAFFGSMASESSMVRSAIMAFAAMQIQRSGMGSSSDVKADWRPLYENASRHLSGVLNKRGKDGDTKGNEGLKHILASIFLLTYTDVSSITPSPRGSQQCILTSSSCLQRHSPEPMQI